MYDMDTQSSPAYIAGFESMAKELNQILEARNQTVLQLFKDIAIE
jgi:hypothetical protein